MSDKTKIPEEVVKAAKKFIKVAIDHDLHDFSMEFKMKKGDTVINKVHWNFGRHGEEKNRCSLWSELRIQEYLEVKTDQS